jgi:hypothetical protein
VTFDYKDYQVAGTETNDTPHERSLSTVFAQYYMLAVKFVIMVLVEA